MDEIDKKILTLLSRNARMTVKEIAKSVALTSPAVGERIRRMEREDVIAGYTVVYGSSITEQHIEALISVSVPPSERTAFLHMAEQQPGITRCCHVTGSYSYILSAICSGISELEHLIGTVQQFGATSSQIVLSTPIERSTSTV